LLDSFVRPGSYVLYPPLRIYYIKIINDIIKIFGLTQKKVCKREQCLGPRNNDPRTCTAVNVCFGQRCFSQGFFMPGKPNKCHNWDRTMTSNTEVDNAWISLTFSAGG